MTTWDPKISPFENSVRGLLWISLVVFFPNMASANEPRSCHEVVAATASAPAERQTKTRSISSIAREHGVEFLMMRMSAEHFQTILDTIAALDGKGEIQLKAEPFFLPGKMNTIDLSLIPLSTNNQSGLFAHQLIRDESDICCMGRRTVLTEQFQVGLLFPVTLLDTQQFEIAGRFGDRLSPFKFDNLESGEFSQTELELLFKELGNGRKYPNSTTAYPLTRIRLLTEVPLSEAQMLWIPAPILRDTYAHLPTVEFPGKGHPWMPTKPGEAFSWQTSVQDSSGKWHNTPVPPDSASVFFDAAEGLGTWFNVVPNWTEVRKALEATPRKPNRFRTLARLQPHPVDR